MLPENDVMEDGYTFQREAIQQSIKSIDGFIEQEWHDIKSLSSSFIGADAGGSTVESVEQLVDSGILHLSVCNVDDQSASAAFNQALLERLGNEAEVEKLVEMLLLIESNEGLNSLLGNSCDDKQADVFADTIDRFISDDTIYRAAGSIDSSRTANVETVTVATGNIIGPAVSKDSDNDFGANSEKKDKKNDKLPGGKKQDGEQQKTEILDIITKYFINILLNPFGEKSEKNGGKNLQMTANPIDGLMACVREVSLRRKCQCLHVLETLVSKNKALELYRKEKVNLVKSEVNLVEKSDVCVFDRVINEFFDKIINMITEDIKSFKMAWEEEEEGAISEFIQSVYYNQIFQALNYMLKVIQKSNIDTKDKKEGIFSFINKNRKDNKPTTNKISTDLFSLILDNLKNFDKRISALENEFIGQKLGHVLKIATSHDVNIVNKWRQNASADDNDTMASLLIQSTNQNEEVMMMTLNQAFFIVWPSDDIDDDDDGGKTGRRGHDNSSDYESGDSNDSRYNRKKMTQKVAYDLLRVFHQTQTIIDVINTMTTAQNINNNNNNNMIIAIENHRQTIDVVVQKYLEDIHAISKDNATTIEQIAIVLSGLNYLNYGVDKKESLCQFIDCNTLDKLKTMETWLRDVMFMRFCRDVWVEEDEEDDGGDDNDDGKSGGGKKNDGNINNNNNNSSDNKINKINDRSNTTCDDNNDNRKKKEKLILRNDVEKWRRENKELRRVLHKYFIQEKNKIILPLLSKHLESFCFRFSNISKDPKYYIDNIWSVLKESAITFTGSCRTFQDLLLSDIGNNVDLRSINNHNNMLLILLVVLGGDDDDILECMQSRLAGSNSQWLGVMVGEWKIKEANNNCESLGMTSVRSVLLCLLKINPTSLPLTVQILFSGKSSLICDLVKNALDSNQSDTQTSKLTHTFLILIMIFKPHLLPSLLLPYMNSNGDVTSFLTTLLADQVYHVFFQVLFEDQDLLGSLSIPTTSLSSPLLDTALSSLPPSSSSSSKKRPAPPPPFPLETIDNNNKNENNNNNNNNNNDNNNNHNKTSSLLPSLKALLSSPKLSRKPNTKPPLPPPPKESLLTEKRDLDGERDERIHIEEGIEKNTEEQKNKTDTERNAQTEQKNDKNAVNFLGVVSAPLMKKITEQNPKKPPRPSPHPPFYFFSENRLLCGCRPSKEYVVDGDCPNEWELLQNFVKKFKDFIAQLPYPLLDLCFRVDNEMESKSDKSKMSVCKSEEDDKNVCAKSENDNKNKSDEVVKAQTKSEDVNLKVNPDDGVKIMNKNNGNKNIKKETNESETKSGSAKDSEPEQEKEREIFVFMLFKLLILSLHKFSTDLYLYAKNNNKNNNSNKNNKNHKTGQSHGFISDDVIVENLCANYINTTTTLIKNRFKATGQQDKKLLKSFEHSFAKKENENTKDQKEEKSTGSGNTGELFNLLDPQYNYQQYNKNNKNNSYADEFRDSILFTDEDLFPDVDKAHLHNASTFLLNNYTKLQRHFVEGCGVQDLKLCFGGFDNSNNNKNNNGGDDCDEAMSVFETFKRDGSFNRKYIRGIHLGVSKQQLKRLLVNRKEFKSKKDNNSYSAQVLNDFIHKF